MDCINDVVLFLEHRSDAFEMHYHLTYEECIDR